MSSVYQWTERGQLLSDEGTSTTLCLSSVAEQGVEKERSAIVLLPLREFPRSPLDRSWAYIGLISCPIRRSRCVTHATASDTKQKENPGCQFD